jgi:hypothetical protein
VRSGVRGVPSARAQRPGGAGADDNNEESSLCPCLGGQGSPLFIGADFYCEAGTTGRPFDTVWFVDDPLWDGDGMGTNCDTPANPSVFHRNLGGAIDVGLEVRLMADQATDNEDVGLSGMELFVR